MTKINNEIKNTKSGVLFINNNVPLYIVYLLNTEKSDCQKQLYYTIYLLSYIHKISISSTMLYCISNFIVSTSAKPTTEYTTRHRSRNNQPHYTNIENVMYTNNRGSSNYPWDTPSPIRSSASRDPWRRRGRAARRPTAWQS